MSGAFESSAAGPLRDDAVLECGVCWAVYDPAQGDEVWDIPAGTPFTALPEHWRCPSCDAPRSKFMLREAGRAAAAAADTSQGARVDALVQAYAAAEASIIGLPVHNSALTIEAVGFRPFAEGYAGVIVTPWCMNIAYVAADPATTPPAPLGATRVHAFPSGGYSFIIGRMDHVGVVETCSLFSPMEEFADPDVARATAESAVEGLFTPPKAVAETAAKPVTRRFLFTHNERPA